MLTLAIVTIVALTLTACFYSDNGNGNANHFKRAQEAFEQAGLTVMLFTREELEQSVGANNLPVGLVRQLVVFTEEGSVAIIEFDSAANAIAAETIPRNEGHEMRINGIIVYSGRGQPFEIARGIIGGSIVP